MTIPKIIHQTAPKEKHKWHPIWKKCHLSWKTCFPRDEYEHIMWTDEDIDNFVKEEYPQYYNFYNNLPFHIMQLDFFRYCVLHKYGGIYADMDIYCYQNFYDDLKDNCYLVESIVIGEKVQNCLMVSSINNYFYIHCIEETIKNFAPFNYELISNTNLWCAYVAKNTGPILLTDIYHSYDNKEMIGLLPKNEYNNPTIGYNKNLKTRHVLTGRWGKEAISLLKQRHMESEMKYISHLEYLKWDFKNFRKIDVDTFDFYE